MSFTQTLQGAWDWIRKINWPYTSFLLFAVSGIVLFAPSQYLCHVYLDGICHDFGQCLGLLFLASGTSVFWHAVKWSVERIRQSPLLVSLRIKRNIKQLGFGSRRAIRVMYQDDNSSTLLSKESVELEILTKFGFIHCGRYISNGNVKCELNGLVIDWLSKHENLLADFPEPDELPF